MNFQSALLQLCCYFLLFTSIRLAWALIHKMHFVVPNETLSKFSWKMCSPSLRWVNVEAVIIPASLRYTKDLHFWIDQDIYGTIVKVHFHISFLESIHWLQIQSNTLFHRFHILFLIIKNCFLHHYWLTFSCSSASS